MRSCGIIVEYNPFHHGHRYHAEHARKLTDAEVVVAVMSGNFLQRGEPAITDKWTRAKAALLNGVDLVVELPFSWAVQSADHFAAGGIKLLQAMNCETLCFGTDGEETFDYESYGRFFIEQQAQIDALFQQLPIGMSYPEKMAEAVRQLYPQSQVFSPNHILGLSYAKENAKYPRPMKLFPLARKDQGFHDESLVEQRFASASGIRKGLLNGGSVTDFLPENTWEQLNVPNISWEDFWQYLRYTLRVSSLEEMQKIYQMNEGIEYRLQQAGQASWSEFLANIRTKRYTTPRLQRLLTYVLLRVKPEEIAREQENTMLHILGFTKKGQEFLSQQRKMIQLPIAAKIGQTEREKLFLTYRSDQIYQFVHPAEQNFGRSPIRV